jgi:multisubunit Na+/H+ antiporter MnhG subunit
MSLNSVTSAVIIAVCAPLLGYWLGYSILYIKASRKRSSFKDQLERS